MKTFELGKKRYRLILFLLPLLLAVTLSAQDTPQNAPPDAQQNMQQQDSQQPDAQQQDSQQADAQQPNAQQDDQNNPPGRVANLSQLQGTVSLQPDGETDWTTAAANATVSTGDRIYTDTDSRAEMEMGPYVARVWQLTDLTIVNLNDQLAQFGIAQGTVQITVFKLDQGNTVEVDTPNGALTLQAPGTYRVDTDPKSGSTLVSVYRGSLQVSGGGASQTVSDGQAVQLTGSDQVQVTRADLAPVDDFEKWVQQRDHRITSSPSAQYVSPDVPGYEDLDENGQWQTGPDGPVWYPNGVAVGWVPYSVGSWGWVEPWGWTWVSAEPWGFAPFHYGRWGFYGGRWGWVPGPVGVFPIYSPALVAFVGGPGFSIGFGVGGFGLSAWFPLGPRDPFIPWYHYGPGYFRAVNVTNIRNVTNINLNIRNVNDIHYAYKTTGVTAVRADAFRSGQPVQKAMVHVDSAELARAQVVAHPSVNPEKSAILSHPVAAPRGAPTTTRFTASARPGATGEPSRTANAPSTPGNNRPAMNEPSRNPASTNNSRTNAPGAPSRPAYVTKNPAPAPKPSFDTRQQAMQSHPGRPLEPQQMNNLRNGMPAGPQRDREMAPHSPPPHMAPSRAPQPQRRP
jgi:hypothetical protein